MDDLDELLVDFIENNFNPVQQDELKNALALFEAFDYDPVYSQLNDVISDTIQEDDDQRRMDFLGTILNASQGLLSAHSLSLLDASELRIMNRILAAIYRVQAIEDPTPILQLLSSGVSNEEKLAKLVDSLSDIDEGVVLAILDDVPDIFIERLTAYLEAQIKGIEPELLDPEQQKLHDQLKAQLKAFYSCHGTDNIATAMDELGFKVGSRASLHWPHIKDDLVTDNDLGTAKNLLSFFLFEIDTFQNPCDAYLKCSETIILEAERRIKIDALIRDLYTTVQNYMKAQDDAQRLSAV